MRVPSDSRNKLLSLLKDVAECSYIRVFEHRQTQTVRHHFGVFHTDFEAEKLGQSAQVNTEVSFYQESYHQAGDYQLTITVLSEQHVNITCIESKNKLPKDARSARRNDVTTDTSGHLTTQAPVTSFELALFHEQHLPAFVQDLGIDSQDLSDFKDTAPDILKRTHVLLSTIVVVVEGLQLIEHYEKLTSDSLTKLQSRTALQKEIDEQIYRSSIALCMVHCIDFQHVNRKFGQAKGDEVLHEIANIINQYTRVEDISGRFGGALFGIAVQANSIEDGYKMAVKLQDALHSKPYLQNAIRLTFNVGVAFVSQAEAELDSTATSSLLISRAEQALKAAQNSNTPSIVQWEPDKFRLDEQEFNYLGGIFTPDNVTNYRNMLLLWDISSIIADEPSFAKLLKSVIERLAYTFEFEYAGVISTLNTSKSNYGFELTNTTDIIEMDWERCKYNDVIRSAAAIALENSQHTEHEEDNNKGLIIPLGTDTLECFVVLGDKDLLDLTHDSVMLFVGFARQIGKALKRSQLEDELNQKLEEQNAILAQELLDLKAGLQSSALVYKSTKMQKVVEQTQRAAQSDTTVLITGESGTGKEKLIHAIHSLSPRANKPLVIVDCGSIPETLIESELFGHMKGAFTGAQNDNKGKIHAANGGIIVLDEIGELPLSMQPKLLRFVQEKHYTPVGSSRSLAVDIKIVAVTNRDLAFEVTQGKFRKDLYYRLNVVSLHNPPLRERREDIPLLCQHFLSKFTRQFEIEKKTLSEHTMALMANYPWPGNIRELENKLMQASLLTTGTEIHFDDLQLEPAPQKEDRPTIEVNTANEWQLQQDTNSHTIPISNLANEEFTEPTTPSPQSPHSDITWESKVTQYIDTLIQECSLPNSRIIPIGAATEAELLHMAFNECGSHSKTALLLQIPVSTARRRLLKPITPFKTLEHTTHWFDLKQALWLIVKRETHFHHPMELIRNLIAARILAAYSNNMTVAAELMGVSEPTMYKFRKALQ